MSRKDYRATAEIIQIFQNSLSAEDYLILVNKFAFMFKMDNSNFNRDKFAQACGVA